MGKVTFHIHPFESSSPISKRDKTKLATLIYLENHETESSWTDRISSCLDPIFNKQFGCFSKDNDKKVSCLAKVLPDVLSCIYFGNYGVNYCIPESSELSCRGECGFSQEEVEKLYGCLNSYGAPPEDCNVYKEDFCDCSKSGKTWNPTINACQCKEGENDYGECCSDIVCKTDEHEVFDCDTKTCQCEDNYFRLPYIPPSHPLSSYSNSCAKPCGTGEDQNNPINYESKTEQSGCGAAIGKEGDLCCLSNQCVIDNGVWDQQYSMNPTTKSECLASYGVWRITNYNTCPREGHCEYPLCTDPVQILDQFQPDGPAWVFKCESCEAPESFTSPQQCETACKNFCSSNTAFPVYEKSHCGPTGTNQDTCICHCSSSD